MLGAKSERKFNKSENTTTLNYHFVQKSESPKTPFLLFISYLYSHIVDFWTFGLSDRRWSDVVFSDFQIFRHFFGFGFHTGSKNYEIDTPL